ncbi:hypothetical protein OC846_003599 [Tilletia horrida]|uniref:Major facilitator superfamily (MFS) profile domain-containing protein n=1 Tax=Tilletia horrida TaxID=155126 RepID=A0AAN6GP62_9BASI|nr:hypothetical protein OC846_003599 [Tilletia horrida]KAK0550890.1 hypothetical protein OC845_002453 [Tilletia horrida]KAK0565734.1 hypothetical protein OC861_003604 [Tilletia horrida]
MHTGLTSSSLKITPIHSNPDRQHADNDPESDSAQNLQRTPTPGILQSATPMTKSTSESSLFVPKTLTISSPAHTPHTRSRTNSLSNPMATRDVDIKATDTDRDDEEQDGSSTPIGVSWAPMPAAPRAPSPTPQKMEVPRTGSSTSASDQSLPSTTPSTLSASSSSSKTISTPTLLGEEEFEDEELSSSRRASVAKSIAELRKQLGLGLEQKKGPPPITPGRTPLIEELEEGTDPLDWSHRFKAWTTFCYCIMIGSTTFGSSAYASATPAIQEAFNVSRTVALLGTSLYVLGFAIGPLIWAPTSEVIGRKPVYVGSFVALTAFGLGVAFAQNIQTLVICRFLSGVCGASALNNVAASLADMTRLRNRLRYNTAYRLVSFGGPTLGPIVGTFALRAGFRWNLRLNPIFSGTALILYAFTIPETHRPTLLRRQQRARERALMAQSDLGQEEEGIKNREAALEKQRLMRQPAGPSILKRYKMAMTTPFKLLKEPLVIIVCMYTALLYGLLYGVLAAFPLIWQEIRGRNEEYASLVYLALLGGFAAGAFFIGCWFQDRSFKRLYDQGEYVPELRIGPAVWASFLIPVGLLVFGLTSPYDKLVGTVDVHFAVPCLALTVFAAGMGVVFNSWLSYLQDAYSTHTASAMAAATFSRSLLGAAFPLFMREMLLGITIQASFAIFAGISLCLSISGICFVKYGHIIRARSKFASHPK